MGSPKIKVGILFGGKSAEHEISLCSAKNVIEALDTEKYEAVLIGVTPFGKWCSSHSATLLTDENGDLSLNKDSTEVALRLQGEGQIINFDNDKFSQQIDVVFPILHGPFGEDGTIQGLLKLANIPFVGASVLGSAVGMDKDIMKRLLRDAKLPIGDYISLQLHQDRPIFSKICEQLGNPCFVKPANLGSSIGINRVENEEQYHKALDEAFSYDRKIVIESFIEGREIECAILGNEFPRVSIPGEITCSHDFYSYQAKYLDDKGFKIDIPAKLTDNQIARIQKIALDTFQVLSCEGLARVDVFLTATDKILVNEINTIPGFTKISMYPKLWEASGISYTELISQLIELAMDRFEKEQQIKCMLD